MRDESSTENLGPSGGGGKPIEDTSYFFSEIIKKDLAPQTLILCDELGPESLTENKVPEKKLGFIVDIIFSDKYRVLQLLNFAKKHGLKSEYNLQESAYENISAEVYNSLMSYLEEVDTNSIKVSKLESIAIMLSLISPKFLMDNSSDITSRLLIKIQECIDSSYLNIKDDCRNKIEDIIPLLEVYTNILISIIYSRQLKFIVDNFRYLDEKAHHNNKSDNEIFFSEAFLSQDQRYQLTYSPAISNLKNHDYMEVKYLSRHIIESVKKLSYPDDLSGANAFVEKGNFIITNSFNTTSSVLCIAPENSFNYARSITNNFKIGGWHNNSILISTAIASTDSIEGALYILEEVKSYYKAEKTLSWEISWAVLKGLVNKSTKHQDLALKTAIVDFVGQVASDARYPKEVTDVATEVLLYAESLDDEVLKDLALKKIQNMHRVSPSKNEVMYDIAAQAESHPEKEENIKSEIRSVLFNEVSDIVGRLKGLKYKLQKEEEPEKKSVIISQIETLRQKFELRKAQFNIFSEVNYEKPNVTPYCSVETYKDHCNYEKEENSLKNNQSTVFSP